jgi:hypothetical protein
MSNTGGQASGARLRGFVIGAILRKEKKKPPNGLRVCIAGETNEETPHQRA